MRPLGAAETLITIHGPGQFTGEVNMLSGRRTLVRMRATKPGKVIELDRQHMMALIQTVALDNKGFIKTGADLSEENLNAAQWSLARQPYLLETSLPGVFAVGDVRGGSIKRVASAVGEGSTEDGYSIIESNESVQVVSKRTTQLLASLEDHLQKWGELYRDLHRHPELSMQEHRTAGIVARHLRDAGYEVTEGVGHTGVVGLLRNGAGPVVMLRGDMDALPVSCQSMSRPV